MALVLEVNVRANPVKVREASYQGRAPAELIGDEV